MPFVSVTRLRIRAFRFLPGFALHAVRTRSQVRRAPGFAGGAILADRGWTFWTLTAWSDEADMRRYILAGAHREAMTRLAHWCDEASVVHWTQAEAGLPCWMEADRRMRAEGRPSKVRIRAAAPDPDLPGAASRRIRADPPRRRGEHRAGSALTRPLACSNEPPVTGSDEGPRHVFKRTRESASAALSFRGRPRGRSGKRRARSSIDLRLREEPRCQNAFRRSTSSIAAWARTSGAARRAP